ncbi:efflux transporter periplasmic adaptor subunit [Scytonema hofmannii PCC 7110]|uniref:Efflux transporter periplasmic adaptor subunit n=1 Tax=Scytonema hofmannii PCC 7110 TaxID=128403 RepID=A0A139WTQ5_9CYAN|nr:efflux RND transporter periplasmic adaptor subunit [Scytonema hofmannii]KYC35793.1 efflux transporter periplasmic adaptor subunit [Scytonema hofmannii PCC 7110]
MKTVEPEVTATDNQLETPAQPDPKSSRPKRIWLWILLVLSLTASGVALWRVFSPTTVVSKPAAAKTPPPRPVEVVQLSPGTGTRRIQLLGQVESTQQATIRAQTSGVIRQVLVQPGDRVTPRMTVAILDDTDQRLAISQAQAQLAQQRSNLARLEVGTRPEIVAQRQAALSSAVAREQEAQDNLQRSTDLVQQGALAKRLLVEAQAALDNAKGERLAAQATLAEAKAGPTREEIDAQRANVAAATAAVNQARLALQRTRIQSLLGGVVQQRLVSSGDLVQNGGQIVNLVAGDRLDIFLELPEELSGRVTPGNTVELTTRALPQWRGRAQITGVVPSADTASRRQRVRVRLNNPPSGLLPGMAVTGNLELPANTLSFIVSRDAITRRQNQWLVFTVANGKAKQYEVELVTDMGEKVAISHPQLKAGQPIVLKGGDGLTNGAAVKVMER